MKQIRYSYRGYTWDVIAWLDGHMHIERVTEEGSYPTTPPPEVMERIDEILLITPEDEERN